MKKTSRINRFLAFFISMVMIVSLMPLYIIAETVDSQTPGITENEIIREEDNNQDELANIGEGDTSSEEDPPADNSEDENTQPSDNAQSDNSSENGENENSESNTDFRKQLHHHKYT